MEGGCPKGRGLAEGERERSQPPALRATSFQRKEGEAGWARSWSRKAWEVLIQSQSQILQEFLYIASRGDAFASLYYRRRCPKVVFKSPITSHSRLLLSALKLRGSGTMGTTNLLAEVCHIINAEEFFPTPCDEENLALDDLE